MSLEFCPKGFKPLSSAIEELGEQCVVGWTGEEQSVETWNTGYYYRRLYDLENEIADLIASTCLAEFKEAWIEAVARFGDAITIKVREAFSSLNETGTSSYWLTYPDSVLKEDRAEFERRGVSPEESAGYALSREAGRAIYARAVLRFRSKNASPIPVMSRYEDSQVVVAINEEDTLDPLELDEEALHSYEQIAEQHLQHLDEARLAAQERLKLIWSWLRPELYDGSLLALILLENGVKQAIESNLWAVNESAEAILKTCEFESRKVFISENFRELCKSHGQLKKSNERDELFRKLSIGEISPEEAEEIARQKGVEPLRDIPDLRKFDPMREPSWSIPMVLAWIMWRTPDQVREHWDEYRKTNFIWFWREHVVPGENGEPEKRSGWYLEAVAPVSALTMQLSQAFDESGETDGHPPTVRFDEAKNELTRKLIDEELAATAIHIPTGNLAQIPFSEWMHLAWGGDSEIRDTLYLDIKPMYQSVVFRAKDVLRLWPSKAPPAVDVSSPEMTLFKASLFVGTGGMELTSGEIVARNLDDEGAEKIFNMLASEKLTARGLNRSRQLREQIPAEYWERAYCGEEPQDGHYVDFIDDSRADLDGFGGTLTPHGESEPKWKDIRVRTKELLEVCSFDSKSPEANRPERAANAQKQRSRKRGGFEASDTPLVQEIHQLLASGEETSPYAAALRFADRAKGSGSPESKQRRLYERYRKMYSQN